MSDEVLRKALRELERTGAQLVPRPSDAIIAWIAREAAFEPNQEVSQCSPLEVFPVRRQDPQRLGIPTGLTSWLRSFGADRLCLAPRPMDRIRCDLPLGHDGDHCRTTKNAKYTWEATSSPCEASYDSGRLRCVLLSDHGGHHEYKAVDDSQSKRSVTPYDELV